MEKQVKQIRDEIFQLALKSPDLETMHWYIALDNCFENDEFPVDEISSMVWRCQVLLMKHQQVQHIAIEIDKLIKESGYAVEMGKDITETKIVRAMK